MACEWDYISSLKTLQEPHEAMPRLKDLLEYLASSGLEDIWLLLDIKVAFASKTYTAAILLLTYSLA